MKWLILLGGLLLLIAAPADATSGMICETAGARPIRLYVVIGHAALPAVASARLEEQGRDVPIAVAQSWLDSRELRLDLVDPKSLRHELRLRVIQNGDRYDGSVWRKGIRRWVRCRES